MDDLPVCGYCNFVTAARRKRPCRLVRYCDEVCRDRDYPRHKEVCVWRAARHHRGEERVWRAGTRMFLEHLSTREPLFDPGVVKLLARFLA